MGIFEKFKSGFKKSASAFTTGLRDIVVKKEIDDKTLDKIEDYLIPVSYTHLTLPTIQPV